jgi:hypothetical protein
MTLLPYPSSLRDRLQQETSERQSAQTYVAVALLSQSTARKVEALHRATSLEPRNALARFLLARANVDALKVVWNERRQVVTFPQPYRGPGSDSQLIADAERDVVEFRKVDPQNGLGDELLAYVRYFQGRDAEAVRLIEPGVARKRWYRYQVEQRQALLGALDALRLPDPIPLVYAAYSFSGVLLSRDVGALDDLGRMVIDRATSARRAGDNAEAIRLYALAMRLGEQVRVHADDPDALFSGTAIQQAVAGAWSPLSETGMRRLELPKASTSREWMPEREQYRMAPYVPSAAVELRLSRREAEYACTAYLTAHSPELSRRFLRQWAVSDVMGDAMRERIQGEMWYSQGTTTQSTAFVLRAWQVILLSASMIAAALTLLAFLLRVAVPRRLRTGLESASADDPLGSRTARILLSACPLAGVLLSDWYAIRGSSQVWQGSMPYALAIVPAVTLLGYTLLEAAWRRAFPIAPSHRRFWLTWTVRFSAVAPLLLVILLAGYVWLFVPGRTWAAYAAHEATPIVRYGEWARYNWGQVRNPVK